MGAREPQPGFQFDLCVRNAFLEERGVHAPRLTKTGTTIAGIIFKASSQSSISLAAAQAARRSRWRTLTHRQRPLLARLSAVASAAGWRRPGRRHPLHGWLDRGRQELREDPLHRAQHLLLRRWHGGRHRERHGWVSQPHSLPSACQCRGQPGDTPADQAACAGMISSNLELHRYATGRKSRVVTAMTLLKSHLFRRACTSSCHLAVLAHLGACASWQPLPCASRVAAG